MLSAHQYIITRFSKITLSSILWCVHNVDSVITQWSQWYPTSLSLYPFTTSSPTDYNTIYILKAPAKQTFRVTSMFSSPDLWEGKLWLVSKQIKNSENQQDGLTMSATTKRMKAMTLSCSWRQKSDNKVYM